MLNLHFLLMGIFAFALVVSCSKSDSINQPEPPLPFQPKNVLFIGNSHTYFNGGVDGNLKQLLNNTTIGYTPDVRKIAISGYTLEDHWNDESTQNMLNLIDWDVIILQENSERASTDANALFQYANLFNDKAKQLNAKVYLFMTWAFEDSPQMTGQLEANYMQVANQLNVKMVPVGLGFQQFIQENQDINLYDPDGIHPSKAGTFLSACFFYQSIYDLPVSDNVYNGSLTETQASQIKTFTSQYFN